jgi:hypothetical protein
MNPYVNDILFATSSILSTHSQQGIHALSVYIIKGGKEYTVFVPNHICDPHVYNMLITGDFEVVLVRMSMYSNVASLMWQTIFCAGNKPIYMGVHRLIETPDHVFGAQTHPENVLPKEAPSTKPKRMTDHDAQCVPKYPTSYLETEAVEALKLMNTVLSFGHHVRNPNPSQRHS